MCSLYDFLGRYPTVILWVSYGYPMVSPAVWPYFGPTLGVLGMYKRHAKVQKKYDICKFLCRKSQKYLHICKIFRIFVLAFGETRATSGQSHCPATDENPAKPVSGCDPDAINKERLARNKEKLKKPDERNRLI